MMPEVLGSIGNMDLVTKLLFTLGCGSKVLIARVGIEAGRVDDGEGRVDDGVSVVKFLQFGC